MRVAYFTAGTHGAGHLVRGLALRRALLRAAPSTTFALFSPASPFRRITGSGAADCAVDVVVDANVLRHPATAKTSDVARALGEFAPDVVVIDVFWVPLVFVPLPCPAWLLLRSVPPKWLIGPREAPFDAGRYERVFAIEPAPGLERFDALDPVVVVDKDDVAASSARFAGRSVIAQAGLPGDRAVLADAAAKIGGDWTTLDLHDDDAPFPAAPLLAHADRVVTAPGYNAYWEARLLGYAPRSTFVPIKRTLDDAAWRASLPTTTTTTNGAHTLARLLIDRFASRPR